MNELIGSYRPELVAVKKRDAALLHEIVFQTLPAMSAFLLVNDQITTAQDDRV